ncbi:MAG: hypothetical protein MHM6MM_007596 [Cercozoa sp. M6MM]
MPEKILIRRWRFPRSIKSEYRKEYIKRDLGEEARGVSERLHHHRVAFPRPVKFHGESTMASAYTRKELPAQVDLQVTGKKFQESFKLVRKAKFEGSSEQATAYTFKELPPEETAQHRPHVWKPPKRHRFVSHSSYQDDFVSRELPRTSKPEIAPKELKFPRSVPFPADMQSSYKRDFVPKQLPKEAHSAESPLRRRKFSAPKRNFPFGESTNQASYKAYTIEAPSTPPRTAVPRYVPSKAKFVGESLYSQEFHEHKLPVPDEASRAKQLAKRTALLKRSSAPFKAESTYSVTFDGEAAKQYCRTALEELTKSRLQRPRTRVEAKAKFEESTTYKCDFDRKELSSEKLVRTRPKLKRTVPFYKGDSTAHEAYRKYEIKKVPESKPVACALPKPIEFEGTSTYRVDYVRKPVETRTMCLPRRVGVTESRDFQTEQRSRYTQPGRDAFSKIPEYCCYLLATYILVRVG